MTNQDKVYKKILDVRAAVTANDNKQIVAQLVELSKMSYEQGMDAAQTLDALKVNGVTGNDSLKNFIEKQFETINNAASQ